MGCDEQRTVSHAREVEVKSQVSRPWYADTGPSTSSSRRWCVRSLREPSWVVKDAETIRLLLIRTAGELRLSNFLLWETAYSEIYVTPTCWPDFDRAHLIAALAEYQKRTRKFGAVVE